MTVAPIVPAGASRPGERLDFLGPSESNVRFRLDFSKPGPPITLTDDEDDDDDPFGTKKAPSKSKFNDFSFDPVVRSILIHLRSTNISIQPAPAKPTEPIAKPPTTNDFDSDEEKEEPLFGDPQRKATLPPVPKPTPPVDDNSWSNDDEQKSQKEQESEDEPPEVKKPTGVSMFGSGAGMSALEAAIAARRRKVEGVEEPEKDENEEEKVK